MTRSQVERFVGPLFFVGSEQCDTYEVPRRPEIATLGFLDGRLVWLGGSLPSLIRSRDGIKTGDASEVLQRVYGDRMLKTKDDHQPPDDPAFWTAAVRIGRYSLEYVVEENRINSIFSSSIAEGEGCPD